MLHSRGCNSTFPFVTFDKRRRLFLSWATGFDFPSCGKFSFLCDLVYHIHFIFLLYFSFDSSSSRNIFPALFCYFVFSFFFTGWEFFNFFLGHFLKPCMTLSLITITFSTSATLSAPIRIFTLLLHVSEGYLMLEKEVAYDFSLTEWHREEKNTQINWGGTGYRLFENKVRGCPGTWDAYPRLGFFFQGCPWNAATQEKEQKKNLHLKIIQVKWDSVRCVPKWKRKKKQMKKRNLAGCLPPHPSACFSFDFMCALRVVSRGSEKLNVRRHSAD